MNPTLGRLPSVRTYGAIGSAVALVFGMGACAVAPVPKDAVGAATEAQRVHCGNDLKEDSRLFAPELVVDVSQLTRP